LVSGPHWEKTPKNINFLGRILTKTMRNYPKYRKIKDVQSEFGPQKIIFGHYLLTYFIAILQWSIGHPSSASIDGGF
jgi:hypothetical protein